MQSSDRNQSIGAPPAPFKQTSTNVLEFREGGGLFALLGLPFLVAGVFMALSLAGILPSKAEPEGTWGPLALSVAAVAFLAAGSVLVFGRRCVTLDLSYGSVSRRESVLLPLRNEERRLTEFTALVAGFRPGDSDSPDKYPVRLRALAGKDFLLASPAKYSESRQLAEYLCQALGLPLADMTTDHENIVQPAATGEALRERLVSGGAESGTAARPVAMRCEVKESQGETTVAIPGETSFQAVALGLVLPAFALLVVGPILLRSIERNGIPGVFAVLMAIFVVPVTAGIVTLTIGRKRKGTTVRASTSGLVIERRGFLRTRTRQVSASEILDLDYRTFEGAWMPEGSRTQAVPPAGSGALSALRAWVGNKGVVVKTRQELIAFGETLPTGELQYLSWVLKQALAGRRK